MATQILVVDDHPEFRRIIRQILQGETDLAVAAEADDGLAAVEYLRHSHPGVVVMDVAMPRLDGFEATRQIKAIRPDTKVLILTVHTDEGYAERARDSGADYYLSKQHVITRLVPAIREMLGGVREQTAS
jgi:DNA-binding NarL/FixJ family response regulator